MTAPDDLLDSTKPNPTTGIRRDRYDRYLIPDPTTGKERSWTRVTTLAGALDDRFGLEKWDQRNVVLGIGARRDLWAKAAAATSADVKTLNKVALEAMDASGKGVKANLGDAVHRFTERIDTGEITADAVPEEWRADVQAYALAMEAAGYVVVPEWTERVVICPELGVAGTLDRLVYHRRNTFRGPNRIGDLKTGKVDYGWLKFAIQLACYARSTHWYDPATGELHEITETIDQTTAVLAHAPVEQGECTLYEVDIEFGWEAAHFAHDLREKYRKRKRIGVVIGETVKVEAPAAEAPTVATGEPGGGEGEASPVTDAPSPPASPERIAWLKDRVQTLYDLGHGASLEGRWLVAICPPPIGDGYSDEQVSTAAAWCDKVEDEHEVPWGTVDPLFAPFFEPPPEPAPPAEPPVDPNEDARHWTTKAGELLDGFSETDVEAIAAAAGLTREDSRMTERRYDLLAALVAELGHPDGAVILGYGADGAVVSPSATAAARMEAACTGPDGKSLGKAAALTRAKAHAKALGLPVPRGLAKAAEHPLLAALVASGREAP